MLSILKKGLRVLGFVCLVALASIGVSISPAPPELPKNRKKKECAIPDIEMVDQSKTTQEFADWQSDPG